MKKFLIYSGVILAILALLYFGIGFWLVNSTGARVAARRAEIQAAGDKVYLTEYETDPIPDEENAFYYLMLAKGDLEAFDEDYASVAEFVELQRRLSPDQVDALASVVEKYPAMFERLDEAATCEGYQPDYDYSQGFALLLSHVDHFRSAARAYSARGMVDAYRDDNGDSGLHGCESSL